METKDFKKGEKYIVESDFEFDGEEFKIGHMFKVLDNVNTPAEVHYVAAEWEHRLTNGHNEDGIGKDGHCWDVDKDIISKHCKKIGLIENVKPKEKVVVLKRLTKKEFKTVLKSLHEA